MRSLKDMSIRNKLTVIAMLAFGITILAAAAAFIAYDQYTFRIAMISDLEVFADVIATNSASTVIFDDRNGAREVLGALIANPEIECAVIFNAGGEVFAQFVRPEYQGNFHPPVPQPASHVFEHGSLHMYRHISFDHEHLGVLYLQMGLGQLHGRLRAFGSVALTIVLGAFLVLWLAISRLQKIVSRPIVQLAETARKVSDEQDYGVRAAMVGRDEVGLLVATFNKMLDLIQYRDRALMSAKEELEGRVKERTKALQQEIQIRQQAEQTLRESETRFRSMIENSSDVITIIGADGIIKYASPSVVSVLGYNKEELEGTSLETLVHPADVTQVRETLELVMQNPRIPVAMEYRYRAKDASWRHVEAFAMNLLEETAVGGIVVNTRDISDRKGAEERIRASLEEKEVMLKEIHHRVKNNLQVISSLLSLQSSKIHDAAVRDMFCDSEHRVRSMALIHEQLYRSNDLGRIDISAYVQNLTSSLRRAFQGGTGRVALKCDIDEIYLGVDQAVPCGLIINELVSNALKHGYPDNRSGVISVVIRQEQGTGITLQVSDDGIGLPHEFDHTKCQSLGLQLVDTLVSQLGASIEVEDSDGTVWRIVFAYKGNGVTKHVGTA